VDVKISCGWAVASGPWQVLVHLVRRENVFEHNCHRYFKRIPIPAVRILKPLCPSVRRMKQFKTDNAIVISDIGEFYKKKL
jgi:hypothetical protein